MAETETELKKPKKGHGCLVTAIILCILLVGGGGALVYLKQQDKNETEQRAYRAALNSMEPTVLRHYLDMHADGPKAHRDSIMQQLRVVEGIESEWNDVLRNLSSDRLRSFVKRYPKNVHVPDANIRIDSLDWVAASAENTAEAYQRYMTEHAYGSHFDEARLCYDKVASLQVSDDEKEMLRLLFHNYFVALSQGDESRLLATLAPELTTFMHRTKASQQEVLLYMQKLHQPADLKRILYRLTNDWHIEKEPLDDDSFFFNVTVVVDQSISYTNPEKDRFDTYKVVAIVTAGGRIMGLNMQKMLG